MEKNVIIKNIVEKEVYHITKCVHAGEDKCSLFLSNQSGKFIRNNLPRRQVLSAIKKHNLFWRWIYGGKYQSAYVIEKIPYYDQEWKSFTWREYIDEKELSCNNDFPEALSVSLQNLEDCYLKFIDIIKSGFAEYRKQLSVKTRLSPVLDIYWAEILCRQNKHRQILDMIYPLLLKISSDKKVIAHVDAPQTVAKFLCLSQRFERLSLEKLAEVYIDNIYKYLLSCYQIDLDILQDIYNGEKNIGKQDSILNYESYLYFFDAIEHVIKCLEIK